MHNLILNYYLSDVSDSSNCPSSLDRAHEYRCSWSSPRCSRHSHSSSFLLHSEGAESVHCAHYVTLECDWIPSKWWEGRLVFSRSCLRCTAFGVCQVFLQPSVTSHFVVIHQLHHQSRVRDHPQIVKECSWTLPYLTASSVGYCTREAFYQTFINKLPPSRSFYECHSYLAFLVFWESFDWRRANKVYQHHLHETNFSAFAVQ